MGKTHGRCWADINFAAIRSNLEYARACAPDSQLLFAVKADAYGHGIVPVAQMAESYVDWLGIATVTEAETLREAGITCPILKLSGAMPDRVDAAIEADVSLTVTDDETIAQAQEAAEYLGRQAQVHLKVDTGMGRVGCLPEKAVCLARRIDDQPNLSLQGVFTHLPVSDSDTEYTDSQIESFRNVVADIEAARGEVEYVHWANSGAILAGQADGSNLVRAGIMGYGYDPSGASSPELTPAMCWMARVSFLKHVKAGTMVSYGHTWSAERDTWIATVAAGYGDGYLRANSNRGRVTIKGESYPVVGRVCMDQMLVDLGQKTPSVVPGDPVVLLSKNGPTADEVAAACDTISYEILCSVLPRVRRNYRG